MSPVRVAFAVSPAGRFDTSILPAATKSSPSVPVKVLLSAGAINDIISESSIEPSSDKDSQTIFLLYAKLFIGYI